MASSAMSLALAACGSDSPDDSASSTSAAPTVTAEAAPAEDTEAASTEGTASTVVQQPRGEPPNRLKHESPLARGGFRIAGAGFEPATFGL